MKLRFEVSLKGALSMTASHLLVSTIVKPMHLHCRSSRQAIEQHSHCKVILLLQTHGDTAMAGQIRATTAIKMTDYHSQKFVPAQADEAFEGRQRSSLLLQVPQNRYMGFEALIDQSAYP